MTPACAGRDPLHAFWMRQTAEQNLAYADMADPKVMNEIIWFSVRGAQSKMPEVARLAVVDAMREAFREMEEREENERPERPLKTQIARK